MGCLPGSLLWDFPNSCALTSTNLQSNTMNCVMFPICTGSYSPSTLILNGDLCLTAGLTYIGWDDSDHYVTCLKHYLLCLECKGQVTTRNIESIETTTKGKCKISIGTRISLADSAFLCHSRIGVSFSILCKLGTQNQSYLILAHEIK